MIEPITMMAMVAWSVLGIAVLGEPVTAGILVGFPLVLLGSFLATRRAPAMEDEPVPA